MSRIISFVLLLSCFLHCNSILAPKKKNTLLFEITGNDLKEPSYIFGTIHYIPAAYYQMWPELKSVAEKVKKHIYEIDTEEMQKAMMKKMIGKKPITWSSQVTDEERIKILTYLTDSIKVSNMTMMMANMYSPIVASQIILMENYGENPKSYEQELAKIAKSKGIETGGLESVEEQLAILDSVDIEEQMKIFKETVYEFRKSKRTLEELFESYSKHDLKAISKLTDEMEKSEDTYTKVLKNRNVKWIKPMKIEMEEGSCLFAVGAAHLIGDDGIIPLLEAEGYEIRAVKLGE